MDGRKDVDGRGRTWTDETPGDGVGGGPGGQSRNGRFSARHFGTKVEFFGVNIELKSSPHVILLSISTLNHELSIFWV